MLAGYSAAQAPPPPPKLPDPKLPALLTAKPLKEDPKDDELRKLLKARYNAAVDEVATLYKMYLAGRGNIDGFIDAGQRLVKAGLELHDKPADKIALLTQFVELAREAEKIAEARMGFSGTAAEFYRVRYQRLDAEIQLLRAKREADKAKGK
jgi:hypothetical protein